MTELGEAAAGTPVTVFDDAEQLGETLAREILEGIERTPAGERYLLGCPSGRSLRSTYGALARLVRPDADLSRLVIVMMDEYVVGEHGSFVRLASSLTHTCAWFAEHEIRRPLSAAVPGGKGIPPEHVWLPDPVDPEAYDRRIADAGGVELFLAASGAGDGHVAFNPPPADLGGGSRVIELAEQTRRDNMETFPQFAALDEVPRFGVSVGLGTIAALSRSVIMVLSGEAKRVSATRILAARDFDPAWPATFIHRCPNPCIALDRSALEGGRLRRDPIASLT
jgi:glucosamine-6-phosphate deaminase